MQKQTKYLTCLLLALGILGVPFIGWGIELPSSTLFPMKVGTAGELTNTKGDVLRWEVTAFAIINDEDMESDVRVEWRIQHRGSVSFVYKIAFIVKLDGWVYLESLSDGFQTRSFLPGIAFLTPDGGFVESMLGEGMAIVKAIRLKSLYLGRSYTDIASATLVMGDHRIKLFWEKTRGLVGLDAGVLYSLR